MTQKSPCGLGRPDCVACPFVTINIISVIIIIMSERWPMKTDGLLAAGWLLSAGENSEIKEKKITERNKILTSNPQEGYMKLDAPYSTLLSIPNVHSVTIHTL